MDDDANRTVSALLLGRYQVRGTLGSGGFGTVSKAFDSVLKRTVAIKALTANLSTTDPMQYRSLEDRFKREAEAGARMGVHSHLIAVYDFAAGTDGTLYLILEYIPGGTLAERMRQGPIPLHDALQITRDAVRGLQAAHEQGIVHRDVKPANIFITSDGHAKVGDFGIAQIDDVSGRTHATTGHPGTPLYMSPEQAQTTGYVRPSSDQYSLGLVLFEMVTGNVYKRLEPQQVANLIARQPPGIAALIERMIAENSGERYENMAAVLAALDGAARAPEVGAYPPGATAYASDATAPTLANDAIPTRQETPRINLNPRPSVMAMPPHAPAMSFSRRTLLVGAGALIVTGGAAGITVTAIRSKGTVTSSTATQPLTVAAATDASQGSATAPVRPTAPLSSPGAAAIIVATNTAVPPTMTPVVAVSTQSPSVVTATPVIPTNTATPVIAPLSATLLRSLVGHDDVVRSVAFSPDGGTLVTGSRDKTVRLWHVNDGKSFQTLSGHSNWLLGVAFAPDGQSVASASQDKTARLWRVPGGSAIRTLSGHSDWVWGVAFSSDGQMLATTSQDRTIKLWRSSDGSLLRTLSGHADGVIAVAFSPDGGMLATCSADQTTRLWRVGDGSLVRTLTGHADSVVCVVFLPDGQTLATGSKDQSVRLWRVADGAPVRTLTGHGGGVFGIAASSDGRLLATASEDKTARLWSVADGAQRQTLDHPDWLWSVAFSPDGRVVATASADHIARLWQVR